MRGLAWVVGFGILAASGAAQAAPVHRITVDVRGPVALVEVTRPVAFGPGSVTGWTDEHAVGLSLPAGAALAGVDVSALGDEIALRPERAADAVARLQEHAKSRGLLVKARAFDGDEDARVRVFARGAAAARPESWTLRYRYVVPLECKQGRYTLQGPATLEPDPAPARVSLSWHLGGGRRARDVRVEGGTASGRAFAVSSRTPWALSFAIAGEAADAPLAVVAGAHVAAGVCRSPTSAARLAPLPERVILLIDRSRSVGGTGATLQGDFALELLRALPPSVRFNAVLFDRNATPLFPQLRTATNEALMALSSALAPSEQHNGTDVPAAVASAAAHLRADGAEGPTWLVLLTDGALPDREPTDALRRAAAALGRDVRSAVVILRPAHDEPPARAVLDHLAALPAATGGVARSLTSADVGGAVPALVASLRAGGDLLAVSLGSGRETHVFAPAVAPGAGAVSGWRANLRPGRAVWTANASAKTERGHVDVVSVPAAFAPGFAAFTASALTSGFAAGRQVAAFYEPAPVAPPQGDAIARGEMERSIVRNALTVGFKPRARACYLARPVRQSADLDLRGRVRMELHLERGELVDAEITRSTLERPDIERCLREAAFATVVPRAFAADAPVLAVLNLVFQPATDRSPPPAPTAADHEIEMILGPPSGNDPLDLVGGAAGAAVDGGAHRRL